MERPLNCYRLTGSIPTTLEHLPPTAAGPGPPAPGLPQLICNLSFQAGGAFQACSKIPVQDMLTWQNLLRSVRL